MTKGYFSSSLERQVKLIPCLLGLFHALPSQHSLAHAKMFFQFKMAMLLL